MNSKTLFHLAFPVTNIPQTKAFYVEGLGCTAGRENAHSIILNLYDHQLVAHVISADAIAPQKGIYPRHFGLIFTDLADWEVLLGRAQRQSLQFYQQPKQRFTGSPLEHRTFFLADPFSNFMEFKHYSHPTAIFGEAGYAEIGDRT